MCISGEVERKLEEEDEVMKFKLFPLKKKGEMMKCYKSFSHLIPFTLSFSQCSKRMVQFTHSFSE